MFVASLTRGVKAGLVAGLVFALFVAVVATPFVAYADGLHHEGGHDHADNEPSSLAVGDAVSVLSAGLWAVLLGGLVFGVGFYVLEPALPGSGATRSYALGVAGFVTVSGAPWLVLPPVGPGAEHSLGTTARLLWYGGMMVAGALACLLAGYAYERLGGERGRLAGAGAALAALCVLAVPALLAPTGATNGALPATLQAGLTGLVVFGQALLWATLATAHAHFDGPGGTDTEALTASAESVGAD